MPDHDPLVASKRTKATARPARSVVQKLTGRWQRWVARRGKTSTYYCLLFAVIIVDIVTYIWVLIVAHPADLHLFAQKDYAVSAIAKLTDDRAIKISAIDQKKVAAQNQHGFKFAGAGQVGNVSQRPHIAAATMANSAVKAETSASHITSSRYAVLTIDRLHVKQFGPDLNWAALSGGFAFVALVNVVFWQLIRIELEDHRIEEAALKARFAKIRWSAQKRVVSNWMYVNRLPKSAINRRSRPPLPALISPPGIRLKKHYKSVPASRLKVTRCSLKHCRSI